MPGRTIIPQNYNLIYPTKQNPKIKQDIIVVEMLRTGTGMQVKNNISTLYNFLSYVQGILHFIYFNTLLCM